MTNWDTRADWRLRNTQALRDAGIRYTSHNDGVHLKIGTLDFWPGTGKWKDKITSGQGVQELISHLKRKNPIVTTQGDHMIKILTAEQMFEVAKRVKPLNLESVCEALQKEIYGS